jgi:hypothetical protein
LSHASLSMAPNVCLFGPKPQRGSTHARTHARTVTLPASQISRLTSKHESASLITVIVRHLLLNEFQHLISISRFQVEWHTPAFSHFGGISCRLNIGGVPCNVCKTHRAECHRHKLFVVSHLPISLVRWHITKLNWHGII